MSRFAERYGPRALVTGAAQGLGEAFARELARRGVDLLLVDVQEGPLVHVAGEFSRHVDVKTIAGDLARPEVLAEVEAAMLELEIGLLVSNAAIAPLGAFHLTPVATLDRSIDVNVRAPARLSRAVLPAMVARGRGGLVLLSSLAGFHGSPGLAAYAASRAYNRALGESLWAELSPRGVDVLAVAPGPIDTPAYRRSRPAPGRGPRQASTSEVALAALDTLGRAPVLVPGLVNKLGAVLLDRALPRAAATRLMHRGLRRLYGARLERAPE